MDSTPLDEVLSLVADRTAAFTGATACVLLLVHEDDGLARVVRSIGVDPERSSRLAQRMFDVAIRRGGQVLGRNDGALFLLEPDGQHIRGFSEVRDRARRDAVIALDDTPNTRRTLDTLQPHFFTYDEGGPAEREWMRRSRGSPPPPCG